MNINVFGARENNLKDINVNLPIGKIIGITGVSGSGKSTLAKDVIAKIGYKNYALNVPTSEKNFITDDSIIDVDAVENLPATLMIDVINSINNPKSTLSTVTGIHYILRKIFSQFGVMKCPQCGEIVEEDVADILKKMSCPLLFELKLDSKYADRLKKIDSICDVEKIIYFDEDGKITTKKSLQKYCYIYVDKKDRGIKSLITKAREKVGVSLKAQIDDKYTTIDLETQVLCSKCNYVLPKKTMKLFSFNLERNEGGGACNYCNGSGKEISINWEQLITHKDKPINNGGIKLIGEKGLKYTTVTEKFLEAVAKHFSFSLEMSYVELSEKQRDVLLNGSSEVIKYIDRQGANDGKKEEAFMGIIFYLKESLKSGKGKKELEDYLEVQDCPHCKGTRLDSVVQNIKVQDYSIQEFLKMTIEELLIKVEELIKNLKNQMAYKYLVELKNKLEVYKRVGCGYLTLDRESSTLSGGELQRLRLCTFIGNQVNNMCIILDEPTTGLHARDINCITQIINELKQRGNTVIIVEHNKQLLRECDYLVDLGVGGGKEGGEVLFSDMYENINNYSTATTSFLLEDHHILPAIRDAQSEKKDKMIVFENISANNIHNQTVQMPLYKLIAICGVSGSGKSSFVNKVLIPKIKEDPKAFKVKGIENLGQKNGVKSTVSNVGSLLDINDKIAKLFVGIQKELNQSCFMINSKEGKCPICEGKGNISDNGADQVCPECEGKRFNEQVLKVRYKSFNIHEILNLPIAELAQVMANEKEIHEILFNCIEIGIDYLTLMRTSKTLSKGEIQRIKLVATLASNKKNYIYVLDEPTKGLHNSDIERLYRMICRVIEGNNTVITIEHNLDFIMKSDYIVEFGPESGKNGGKVIYNGEKDGIMKCQTPTASTMAGISRVNKISTPELDEDMCIRIDDTYINLEKNKVNVISIASKEIDLLSNHMNYNYLKGISPAANLITSTLSVENEIEVKNIPVIRVISPTKRLYAKNIRVIDILNIENAVATLFINSMHEEREISKQVFNVNSKVGKCKVCKGTGEIETVDLQLLLKDGLLNAETEKLLKKRTNYTLAKKYLKKDYKIDIAQNYNEMSEIEKQIFIYGDRTKKFKDKSKEYYWEGVNKLVIKQLNYYDSKALIADVKASKHSRECSVCKGRLLDTNYRGVTIDNIDFYSFLRLPIERLGELVVRNNNLEGKSAVNKLIDVSSIFKKFELGHLTLSTSIEQLPLFEKMMLQYMSYRLNNIYGSVIAFDGMAWIKNSPLREKFMEDLIELSKQNTIIINVSIDDRMKIEEELDSYGKN